MNGAAEQLLRGALETLSRLRGAAATAARTMIEVALSLEQGQSLPAPASPSKSEHARAAAQARWNRPAPRHARHARASSEHAPGMPEHDASLSLFSSDQDPKRESGRMPTLLERRVLAEDRMPPELRALAEREGVRDVDRCWRRFCAHHAGKTLDVAKTWRMWLAGERDRAPPGAPAPAKVDHAAKERAAQAADLELRRQRAGPGLVRASVAEVLAKIGGAPCAASG